MKQTEETSNSTLDRSACKVSTPSNVITYFVCARLSQPRDNCIVSYRLVYHFRITKPEIKPSCVGCIIPSLRVDVANKKKSSIAW